MQWVRWLVRELGHRNGRQKWIDLLKTVRPGAPATSAGWAAGSRCCGAGASAAAVRPAPSTSWCTRWASCTSTTAPTATTTSASTTPTSRTAGATTSASTTTTRSTTWASPTTPVSWPGQQRSQTWWLFDHSSSSESLTVFTPVVQGLSDYFHREEIVLSSPDGGAHCAIVALCVCVCVCTISQQKSSPTQSNWKLSGWHYLGHILFRLSPPWSDTVRRVLLPQHPAVGERFEWRFSFRSKVSNTRKSSRFQETCSLDWAWGAIGIPLQRHSIVLPMTNDSGTFFWLSKSRQPSK